VTADKKKIGLRLRTALLYAGAFILFLSLFFALSYFTIKDALILRSDQEVQRQLSAILEEFSQDTSTAHLNLLVNHLGVTGESRLAVIIRSNSTGKVWGPLGPAELTSILSDSSHTPATDKILQVTVKDYTARAAMNFYFLEELEEVMVSSFGWMLLIGVLCALGAGYIVAGLAVKPIQNLIYSADAIGKNQRELVLLPEQSVSEVERLRNALNDLLKERHRNIETLRSFTADAAHELRTPLTILKGELEVELRQHTLSNDTREILEGNLEQTNRLIAIVEDMLFLSRIEEQPVQEYGQELFDIAELVRITVVRLSAKALQKNITVRLDSLVSATIQGNALAFERMITNLLDNAISYTQEGGQVTIRTDKTETIYRLIIRDNGPGILPEHLEKIFDRFYRAEPSRTRKLGGAGLGLSIAKQVAENHSATLRMESEIGKGTSAIVASAIVEIRL